MRSIIRPICNKVVSDYEATGKLDAAPFLELFEPEIGMRLEVARYFNLFFKKEAGEEVADDAKTKFAHEG